MKIQTPPGMRDFYPEDMRLQNWLFDAWRRVSESSGFEAYEGPIFEFLDLYRVKSGDEIVTQLFHVRHGGAEAAQFAIRPEMTPTLARMIAARANALPRPIKWYSIPRMCRAERQQRGRLREFFQWNVDILGIEEPLADAEVVAVAANLFKNVGVEPQEVVIRYSSRPLVAAALRKIGVHADSIDKACQLIDRVDKFGDAKFSDAWQTELPGQATAAAALDLLRNAKLEDVLKMTAGTAHGDAAGGLDPAAQLRDFQHHLAALGVAEYCDFDLRVVRGLAYYTGIVFEAYPRQIALRALLGGGRYDNLTELVGGPRVTGVGFGAGDAPLIEFLRELQRLPTSAATLDVFVVDADASLFDAALGVVQTLRHAGLTADFSYKRQNLGKQLKQATSRGARWAVIVGQEFAERRTVGLKSLSDGSQVDVTVEDAIRRVRAAAEVI